MLKSDTDPPSEWLIRFSPLIRPGATVLDLACGRGRHSRWLAEHGFLVHAVDRNEAALASLTDVPNITTHHADLENDPWPFTGQRFEAVVVTRYLHRPRMANLLQLVADGGLLIFETYMAGQERFGKPNNPAFLLQRDELLRWLEGWHIVAFEQGETANSMLQRVCASRT